MTALTLVPGQTTLVQLARIYREELSVTLDRAARPGIEAAAAAINAAAAGDVPVYGVNTGFGKLASLRIAPEDTATLQRNLILSHCCGVGDAIPRAHARLLMVLKLLSFGRGASGVRWAFVELLEAMLARGVTPVIPAQGSVGASGDLAPLSHMTAVLIGHGAAEYQGRVLPGAEALTAAGLTPIQLGPKEGLAFINGTQFSTAFALAGLFDGWNAAQSALVTSALSTDAIMGSTAPLQPEIHSLRGHSGQIEAASFMRALLAGSEIRESHIVGDAREPDYALISAPVPAIILPWGEYGKDVPGATSLTDGLRNTAAMLGGALIGGLGGLLGSSAYDRYKGEQNQNEDLTHQLSFEQNQAAQQQALNQQMQSQQVYNQWGQARGYYTPPVNQPGDVQTAQRLLIALGLYNGAIDGLNGPATAQAVQRFQTSHGLEPTGTVTPQLIQQMRQAVAS